MPIDDDERAKLRRLARAAIEIAREEGRGTTELGFWKIVCDRLDRLELGSFPPDESPTKPERRQTPALGIPQEALPPLPPRNATPPSGKASGAFEKAVTLLPSHEGKKTQEITADELDRILEEHPPKHPTQPGLGKKPPR